MDFWVQIQKSCLLYYIFQFWEIFSWKLNKYDLKIFLYKKINNTLDEKVEVQFIFYQKWHDLYIYAKGDSSIFWILTQKNRVKTTAFWWTVLKTFVCCCRGQFIQIKTHNLYFLEYKINTLVHMVHYVGDTIIFVPIRNIFGHFTLDFALILPFTIEINISA